MANMKTVACLLFVLSSAAVGAADGVGPFTFTLNGKAFDERCLRLDAGEALRYRFRSTSPVDFNIHFHRGDDVFYPIRQTGITEGKGTFRAEAADDYCLMWKHRQGAAGIEGSIERVPRR
jgi:hypothetical protein